MTPGKHLGRATLFAFVISAGPSHVYGQSNQEAKGLELLKEIAQLYLQAREASHFRATVTDEGWSAVGSRESRMDYDLFRSARNIKVSMSGPAMRAVIVLDDVFTWHCEQRLKQYVQAKRGDPSATQVEKHVQALFDKLGGRFTLLGEIEVAVEDSGNKSLRLSDREISCRVLKIVPAADGPPDWEEELWVEPGSNLIWKSVLRRRATGTTMASKQTIAWRHIEIGKTPSPDTFVFVPNDGLRRVSAIGARK